MRKKTFNIFRCVAATVAAAVIVAAAALTAQAKRLKLPTVRVAGQEMYYYTWKKGDSLYGVARQLGLTTQEIKDNNPSAIDGLRSGDRLYFPVDPADASAPQAVVDTPQDGPASCVVRKGDTFYSIARHYGLHPDSLLALNPELAGNPIKPGQRLRLKPADEVAQTAQVAQPSEQPQSSQSSHSAQSSEEIPERNPVGTLALLDAARQQEAEPEQSAVAAAAVHAASPDTLRAAVLLPFMLAQPDQAKTTRLFTEFFRGMVLAADSLAKLPGQPVKIAAYDTAGSPDTLRSLLARPEMVDYDLVVAPSEEMQIEMLAQALPSDTEILNIFGVKGENYLSYPNVVQTNIPHEAMYARAIDAFMQRSDGALPVFLARNGGPADKDKFTTMLRLRLTEQGRDFREITYNNTLYFEDLRGLDPDSARVIFIPASGSKAEFAKISKALTLLRERTSDFDGVSVWGYPEWITFRGDAFDDICNLNATIYSRFYADERDRQAQGVRAAYQGRFREEMFDAVPTQGLLGFDTGVYIVNALRQEALTMAEAEEEDDDAVAEAEADFPGEFSGLQSSLRLIRPGATRMGVRPGLVNDALFLIHYRPGGYLTKTVL